MKRIRLHLTVFISLLLLSGITAFPIRSEITFIYFHQGGLPDFLKEWITRLFNDLYQTQPELFYGTDWLAFAHIVISLFFVPIYLYPKQYKINIVIGMIVCLMIFPLAFICGPIRGIPFFHQLIDCSFGVLGFLYLSYILRKINQLKAEV